MKKLIYYLMTLVDMKLESKILNFLKKYNFSLLKKNIYLSPSFLSNHKAGDYQLVNRNYYYANQKK